MFEIKENYSGNINAFQRMSKNDNLVNLVINQKKQSKAYKMDATMPNNLLANK